MQSSLVPFGDCLLIVAPARDRPPARASEPCNPHLPTPPPPPTHTFLQACSILYKTRLPLLLVFNKVDVARHDFALEWLRDFEAFGAALDGESSYAASLSRSMSLVLDSFYQNMRAVGVSAVTGARAWGWG